MNLEFGFLVGRPAANSWRNVLVDRSRDKLDTLLGFQQSLPIYQLPVCLLPHLTYRRSMLVVTSTNLYQNFSEQSVPVGLQNMYRDQFATFNGHYSIVNQSICKYLYNDKPLPNLGNRQCYYLNKQRLFGLHNYQVRQSSLLYHVLYRLEYIFFVLPK